MTKLKTSHDNGSPCLKPRTVSKGPERSVPTLTELQEVVNVILLYQLRRYTELRHCGKNTIPNGATEGSLIVDKKILRVFYIIFLSRVIATLTSSWLCGGISSPSSSIGFGTTPLEAVFVSSSSCSRVESMEETP